MPKWDVILAPWRFYLDDFFPESTRCEYLDPLGSSIIMVEGLSKLNVPGHWQP